MQYIFLCYACFSYWFVAYLLMMKTKKSKTDAGDLEYSKDNDTIKSKQKKSSVKTTQVNSSPSRSNTTIQNTVISTIGHVKKKKKTRNGNKVVTGNLEPNLNKEKVFEGNSSENKKKRKHDVSESTSSVPAKKPKKESSKAKEKLKALSKKKWMKIKKKMKKKKAKKSLEAEGEEDEKSSVCAQISSLEYLRQWKNDKSNWSFQKVRQVWLLKNMYNLERVSSIAVKFL